MPIHFNAGIYALSLVVLAYEIYKVLAREYAPRDKLFMVGYLAPVLGGFIYVYSFLVDDFALYDVYTYSSRSADVITKLASSWSSNGGFIIWMLMSLSIILIYIRLSVVPRVYEGGKRSTHVFVLVSNVSLAILILAIFSSDSFKMFSISPSDGLGLNPLLKTFWNYIHPPSSFLAYAFTLVVAIWAFSGFPEYGQRLLASVSWLLLTMANFLGGVWSYFTLGWGGYWAWDPVETALLIPWIVLTAYFHGMYFGPLFRKALLVLAGFTVAFAGFITRGGAVSPLHGFTGVSWTAFILLVLGIPFIIYALRLFREANYDIFIESIDNTYEFSMNMTTVSLMGIFLVLISGLATQALYSVFMGRDIQISVNYYNFLSTPFVYIFLIFLSGCTLDYLYGRTRDFSINIIAPTIVISLIMGLLAGLRIIVFSPLSSIYTNIVIALLLPPAVISLISAFIHFSRTLLHRIYYKVGLRILHISIPLMMVAILLSGPFAYNQGYFKNILLSSAAPVYVSGVGIYIDGVEFRGPIGWVAIPGAESIPGAPTVPDEVECIVYVSAGDAGQKIPVKARFSFSEFLKGRDGIVPEPTVINLGLDELYIVLVRTSVMRDLYMYYASIINGLLMKAGDNMTKTIYSHVFIFLASRLGVDPNTFYMGVLNWSESSSNIRNNVLAHIKIVPKVGLLWLSGALLLIGEAATIIVESPIGERLRGYEE